MRHVALLWIRLVGRSPATISPRGCGCIVVEVGNIQNLDVSLHGSD